MFLRVKDNGVGMPEEQVMLLNEEFVHGSPASGDKKPRRNRAAQC